MMRMPLLIGIGVAIVVTGVLVVVLPRVTNDNSVQIAEFHPSSAPPHEQPQAGLCPWRNPTEDLKTFFPTATAYREDTLILSRNRIEVGKRLGRTPTGEEHALKLFRILHEQAPLGTIVTRRVRGESGVIELVLAVGNDGKIVGAKIQRLREPDAVAQALQSPAWLASFRGKNGDSAWKLGQDIAQVPEAAHASANAILDGARTVLILWDVGSRLPQGTNVNDPVRVQ